MDAANNCKPIEIAFISRYYCHQWMSFLRWTRHYSFSEDCGCWVNNFKFVTWRRRFDNDNCQAESITENNRNGKGRETASFRVRCLSCHSSPSFSKIVNHRHARLKEKVYDSFDLILINDQLIDSMRKEEKNERAVVITMDHSFEKLSKLPLLSIRSSPSNLAITGNFPEIENSTVA